MNMDQFNLGQRVRVKETGREGTVQAIIFRRTGVSYEILMWDGINLTLTVLDPWEIEKAANRETQIRPLYKDSELDGSLPD